MEVNQQNIYQTRNNQINKVEIQSFKIEQLEKLDLKNKIIEFNFTNNTNQDIYDDVFQFISTNYNQWKGLGLNFRYQKTLKSYEQYQNLAKAINQMNNIEYFSISFGGSIVSSYYAENKLNKYPEWQKTTSRQRLDYTIYNDLIDNISNVVKFSPNLKTFCLDFQGIIKNCIFLLPKLKSIHDNLANCSQLEQYTLSLNHCEVKENEQKNLSEFFSSFIFLKDLKYLKKFVLNIAFWNLSYENYPIFGKIFSEYLTNDKQYLEEFELDHSSTQNITKSDKIDTLTEIQILIKSFKEFLNCNRKHLKKFYLSLCNYVCKDYEVNEFSNIFEYLSKCEQLQKLSLRIQEWTCENDLIEKQFYESMRRLQNIYTLKLFHLSTFQIPQNNESIYYQDAERFMQSLKKRCAILDQFVLMEYFFNHFKRFYRNEVLLHSSQLCNNIVNSVQKNNFSII